MTGIGYMIIHEPFLFFLVPISLARAHTQIWPHRHRQQARKVMLSAPCVCVGSNNNYGDIAFAKRCAQIGWIMNIGLAYV